MSLGVVLTPYGHIPGSFPTGVAFSSKGATQWQKPFDPFWNTRGEFGYYYDTQLGGLGQVPNDFELAKRYGYLPVNSGWVVTNKGYQAGGWLPPDGGYPGQPAATRFPLVPKGLGEVPGSTPVATAEDVLAIMAAHNDRIFALTLVSTTAVAVSAIIGIFRTLKLIKGGKGE